MGKKRLGKGLDALIPELKEDEISGEGHTQMINLDKIEPNPHQPRKNYSQEGIKDLAASIKTHGVIQPIIVKEAQNKYYIVAGERRFKAAMEAGIKEIPAIVKKLSDAQMMQVALLENIQREDLNPVDKSEALSQLLDQYGLTQEKLSSELGISRSALTNILRLKNLHPQVREHLREGRISEGHARALLAFNQDAQEKMVKRIIKEGLSVRAVEAMVKGRDKEKKPPSKKTQQDPFVRDIEEKLTKQLGTKVKIQKGKRKSKIEIECFTDEDLEDVVARLSQ